MHAHRYKGGFRYTLVVLASQCCMNAAAALLGFAVFGGGVGENRGIGSLTGPKLNYDFARVAFTYIGAMLASNEALNYVNYPTQAVGKSCKMVPVMLGKLLPPLHGRIAISCPTA